MSWFDSLVDVGSNIWNWVSGDSITANLARTAVAGYAVNQLANSTTKDNTVSTKTITNTIDKGVRLTIEPSTETRIPVVYGQAALEGIITDAYLSDDNKSMYYCVVLCEQTGLLNLGKGELSWFSLKNVYWNDNKLIFKDTDPATVDYMIDRDGNKDEKVRNKIAIRMYSGNSGRQVTPDGYKRSSLLNAYDMMPNWTNAMQMNGCVFAIIQMDYDKDAGTTALGSMKFHIQNSMDQPGDCLYDYMTSFVYGAGLLEEGIYVQ